MEWKSIIGFPNVPVEAASMMDSDLLLLRSHGLFRGDDAPVNPKREKAIPARRAAIGGRAEQSIDPRKYAHAMFARNALHIQIAAHSAMNVPDVSDGCRPRKETRIAGLAPPRA
jgi:hypothetical protein